MHGFKSAILAILILSKMNGNWKKYPQHVTGSAKSRIYAGKGTKRGFSKKGLERIKFFFLVLGSYESLEGLER